MYDLFISYSSHDRPWAEKLYKDLTSAFPTISIFWDRATIPAGEKWRTLLTDANVNTTHLAIFWSNSAKTSNEVVKEIATFEADVRQSPERGGIARRIFPFPLEGGPGGGIEDIQGFPDLSRHYDLNSTDRGISNLEAGPGLSEWRRAVRMTGDAILSASARQKVIAAIVATNTSQLALLDLIHGMPQKIGAPSLDEFLAQFGLTWALVRTRYGTSARDWHPFGAAETIVDLLEELRVQANGRLDSKYWFTWDYVDLTELMARTPASNIVAQNPEVERLLQEPSVVIVDSISLFDTLVANALRELQLYVHNEQSVIVSLAPVGQSGVDWLARALREQSVPLLDDYFLPQIPPLGRFAMCSINVQRIDELERFVRSRLGLWHLRRKGTEAQDFLRGELRA